MARAKVAPLVLPGLGRTSESDSEGRPTTAWNEVELGELPSAPASKPRADAPAHDPRSPGFTNPNPSRSPGVSFHASVKDSSADEESAKRRLTIDLRSSNNFYAMLPLTAKRRLRVIGLAALSGTLLAISLGVGIPLLGRPYDPYTPVSVSRNGALAGREEFTGLMIMLYLGTLSLMLMANVIPAVASLAPPLRTLQVVVAVCLGAAVLGAALAMRYMIEPQKTYDASVVVGLGDPLLITVGALLFVSLLFLACLSAAVLVRTLPPLTAIRKRCVALVSGHRAWMLIGFFVLLGFTLSNLACSPAGSGETWPGRYFRSTSKYSLVNWVWSDDFVYKLFPDVMGYYLFVAAVCAVSVLAHRRPALCHALHRRVWVPSPKFAKRWSAWHPYLFGISVGEVLLWCAGVVLMLLWLLYWRVVFRYIRYDKLLKLKDHYETEYLARLFGHVCNLLFALLLLPASRTGVWVDVFGIPYDRCIKYHRLLGALGYVFMTGHAMVWWNKWAQEDLLSNNIATVNDLALSPGRYAYQDFSIPMMETTWVMLTVSLVLAVTLRRRVYYIFQHSHKYIGVVVYVTALVHAWSFWYFSAGSLVLWLCDKFSRGLQASCVVVPSELEWHPRNGVAMLKISRDLCQSYKPGQYFFINVPELSLNEWHPFTASAVLDDSLVFYVKRMPKKALLKTTHVPWTARLAELADTTAALPAVRLSGPFGHTDFEHYENIALFAGGIGITPMIAIFADLLRRAGAGRAPAGVKRARLVWMARTTAEFRLFEQIFALAAGPAASLVAKSSRNSLRLNTAIPEGDEDGLESPTFPGFQPRMRIPASSRGHAPPPAPTAMPSVAVASGRPASGPPVATVAAATTSSSETDPDPAHAHEGLAAQGARPHSRPPSSSSPPQHAAPAPEDADHGGKADKAQKDSVDGDPSLRGGVLVGGILFSVQLHCTKRESWVSLSDPNSVDYTSMFIHNGRCNVLNTLAEVGSGPRTVAAVCGPLSLSLDVSTSAWKLKADFHAEQFAF